MTWDLPASETDPQARAATRAWGCTCLRPDLPTPECPYHTIKQHIASLDEHFGAEASHSDFLLFPDLHGNRVEEYKCVDLVDELARRSGETVVDKEGQRMFGERSFQSTGAAYLSYLGIQLLNIQMLAR